MSVTTPPPSGQPMSWELYEAMPEDARREFIDGLAVVTPGPGLDHQGISVALLVALTAVLPATHDATTTWGWKPAEDEFIPDVVVWAVADETGKKRSTGTPALVVEVLCTDRRDDLLLEMAGYAAAGLANHCVVDPRERTLGVHVLDDSGVFRAGRVLRDGDPTVPPSFGAASPTIDVAQLLP